MLLVEDPVADLVVLEAQAVPEAQVVPEAQEDLAAQEARVAQEVLVALEAQEVTVVAQEVVPLAEEVAANVLVLLKFLPYVMFNALLKTFTSALLNLVLLLGVKVLK